MLTKTLLKSKFRVFLCRCLLRQQLFRSYIVDNFLDKMNEISKPGHHSNVNSYYFMGVLILEVLLDIILRDAMLAIASFVFVFLYIRITVGSWVLALIGMTEIVLSVPVSWFIYKVIFRIEYFAFLNTLCLFVVAAIGADDIFIFMDAYKQSLHSDDAEILESLESRMSWVYRRTGAAMAITSATTCAAFLCTLVTPLVDIQSFGIFAAIVIFVDYALVMSLFCTAVVIYHNKFEQPGCFSSCKAGCRTNDPLVTDIAREQIGDVNDTKEDRVSRFFRTRVSTFIDIQLHRVVIAVLFLVWIVVAICKYRFSSTRPKTDLLNSVCNSDRSHEGSRAVLARGPPAAEKHYNSQQRISDCPR